MLSISQVILMRTDSNLCRKELTVHWSAPNSLIRSYLQPCTNSTWGDESEAVAPIIWLYQIVDAQKEEVCFPELLITLRSYVWKMTKPVRIWGQRDSMWLSNHENRSSSLQYMSQTNLVMTTSSKGKIFRVTGPLWRDSSHKGQWHGALMFSLICAWTNGWANNQDPGDLRRHRAHYDVTATSHMVSVIHPDDSHPFCTISIAPSPPDMKLL